MFASVIPSRNGRTRTYGSSSAIARAVRVAFGNPISWTPARSRFMFERLRRSKSARYSSPPTCSIASATALALPTESPITPIRIARSRSCSSAEILFLFRLARSSRNSAAGRTCTARRDHGKRNHVPCSASVAPRRWAAIRLRSTFGARSSAGSRVSTSSASCSPTVSWTAKPPSTTRVASRARAAQSPAGNASGRHASPSGVGRRTSSGSAGALTGRWAPVGRPPRDGRPRSRIRNCWWFI